MIKASVFETLFFIFMKCIKDYTLIKLEDYFSELGYEKFRARQLFYAIYLHRINDFSEDTTLPKELREHLRNFFAMDAISSVKTQMAADGTIKFLFSLVKGSAVESVFIPWDKGLKERRTLCVSSQVGCALDCSFCATGKLGLTRNLTVGEIVDQILWAEKITGERLTNVVFMGMGEPLQNFQNVVQSISILANTKINLFNRKNITVSTSGIVPKIYDLAKIEKPVKLAISLHSTLDGIRETIMPIAKKWKIKELRQAAIDYYRKTFLPITYEYILFDGLNDSELDARRLARFVRSVPSKVNIIPYHRIDFMPLNGISKELKPASSEKIFQFKQWLHSYGVKAFVRSSSGYEIDGACGQLAFSNRYSMEFL